MGNGKDPEFLARLASVDVLLGSWGVPKLFPALLAAAPPLKAVCYEASTVKGFVTPESYRAVFINTARGRLVNEAALIAELEKGRIDAYLDVTHPEPPVADSPLYRLPTCWLTQHRAGSHGDEVRRMGRLAIDEAVRFAANRPFRFPVSEAMLATMA